MTFFLAWDYESLHNILSTALTDRRKTKGRERHDFVYLFFQSMRLFRNERNELETKGMVRMKIMNESMKNINNVFVAILNSKKKVTQFYCYRYVLTLVKIF